LATAFGHQHALFALLHRAIAFALARQPEKLRGNEIRFLRKYLGWSGRDAAQNLHVKPETLSRWENGQTSMGDPSELLLRVLAMTQPPVENYPIEILKKLTLEDAPRAPIRLRGEGEQWELAAAA